MNWFTFGASPTLNKTSGGVRGCGSHDLWRGLVVVGYHGLLQEEADVQTEGGDEPDVEEHDDGEVPAPSCSLVVNIVGSKL